MSHCQHAQTAVVSCPDPPSTLQEERGVGSRYGTRTAADLLSREVDSSPGEEGAWRNKDGAVVSIKGGQEGVGDAPESHIKSCSIPSAEEVGQSCRRTLACESSI